MKCPNCEIEIPNGSSECRYCRLRIDGEGRLGEGLRGMDSPEHRSMKTVGIVVAVCCLAALAGVGLSRMPAGGGLVFSLLLLWWAFVLVGKTYGGSPAFCSGIASFTLRRPSFAAGMSLFLLVVGIVAAGVRASRDPEARPPAPGRASPGSPVGPHEGVEPPPAHGRQAAELAAEEPGPQSQRDSELCSRLMTVLREKCGPFASGHQLQFRQCSVHESSQTGRSADDLGSGLFVRYREGDLFRLEWFAGDGELWATTNGQTASACPDLKDIAQQQSDARRAAAPVRGTDAKSYEGLYDEQGNFRHEDCSDFELRVADTVHREIFRNPDEPESRAMGRVHRKTGLSSEVAAGIYQKAMSNCGWTAPGP